MAAQLSFFFLIFLSALIGFISLDLGLLDKILLELHQFLPEDTYCGGYQDRSRTHQRLEQRHPLSGNCASLVVGLS